MHHKAIKAQIRKQLKIRYLNWHRLTKKEKKAVAKKVLNEVVQIMILNKRLQLLLRSCLASRPNCRQLPL